MTQGLAFLPRTPGWAGTACAATPDPPSLRTSTVPQEKGRVGGGKVPTMPRVHGGSCTRRAAREASAAQLCTGTRSAACSGQSRGHSPAPLTRGFSSALPPGTSRGYHPQLKYQVSSCRNNLAAEPSLGTRLTKRTDPHPALSRAQARQPTPRLQ